MVCHMSLSKTLLLTISTTQEISLVCYNHKFACTCFYFIQEESMEVQNIQTIGSDMESQRQQEPDIPYDDL